MNDLIVILVVLALIGLGYLLYRRVRAVKAASKPNPTTRTDPRFGKNRNEP